VTNSGYSSRGRVFTVELSDVFDEAGVALPFELGLEPEPVVDGSELLLLPTDDPVLLFKRLEMAAGRTGSSDSVSTSVIDSSSCKAPACVEVSFLSLPC
jgi:hypothetical protein